MVAAVVTGANSAGAGGAMQLRRKKIVEVAYRDDGWLGIDSGRFHWLPANLSWPVFGPLEPSILRFETIFLSYSTFYSISQLHKAVEQQ
jgi:hypothetical protein